MGIRGDKHEIYCEEEDGTSVKHSDDCWGDCSVFLLQELLAVGESQADLDVRYAVDEKSNGLQFSLWEVGQNYVLGNDRPSDHKHGIFSSVSVWNEKQTNSECKAKEVETYCGHDRVLTIASPIVSQNPVVDNSWFTPVRTPFKIWDKVASLATNVFS